jgi:signal transduction histidine kinase
VQEALSNVHRHAGASGVAIRLAVTGHGSRRQLRVSVADDGRGPPSAATMDGHEPGGVGRIGMRERLAQLGGQIAMGPSESGGTLISATLPLGR